MSIKVVEEQDVRSFFLNLESSQYVSFLFELHGALKRYSDDSSIVPPRTKCTVKGSEAVHLFMPVADKDICGIKTLGYNPNSGMGFVGAVNVIDAETGRLEGVVDAKQLTGVRTALSSNIGLYINKEIFASDKELNVTVFGSGLQAFWHLFVCAKLFPDKNINVRIVYRANQLDVNELVQYCTNIVDICQVQISDLNAVSSICGNSHVVYGTIPSSSPSIKGDYFQSGQTSSTYISLIGSYQPHMHECDEQLIAPFLKGGKKILVDSKEHTLIESGELIDSKVHESQLIEIGELSSPGDYLDTGFGSRSVMLCKIVGLAIMDVVTAKRVLKEF